MNYTDWISLLVLVVFLIVGNPKIKSYRRQRVTLIVIMFLGLYVSTFSLFPYPLKRVTGRQIMPFRSYNLYSTPAPVAYYCARPLMVTQQGDEYPIDFRIWQPFIPRYFNNLLGKTLNSDAQKQQRVGEAMLKKVRAALDNYHVNGRYREPNAWLLGGLHYPSHQSHEVQWRPGMKLPTSKEVVKIRVYRMDWQITDTKPNSVNFHKEVAYEFPS